MTNTVKNREYGFLIREANVYGQQTLFVDIVVRSTETPGSIINPSSDGENSWDRDGGVAPKRMQGYLLSGLSLQWYYSAAGYAHSSIEYRDTYTVELRRAEAMVKTLKKVQKAQLTTGFNSRYPFTCINALVEAFGLTFWANEVRGGSSMYTGNKYEFATVNEGVMEFCHRAMKLANNTTGEKKELVAF